MNEQEQKDLVKNCHFALEILKCHKKVCRLILLKQILVCFDFLGTCIKQQNFSICLTKNLVNFLLITGQHIQKSDA